jgi:anaerobic magnesium-protoporphyrin IX monomethyl ester cyclase
MNRRIVLVFPQITKGWQARPRMAMPMSLLCLATPVMNAGYDVKIIDQRVEPRWESILTQELQQDPLCVGVSSMTGPQLRHALDISKMVKEYGNSPVIWGGTHASLLPAQTLRNENIDIVVQGDGEETFPELVEALDGKRPLSTVKGIWYKDNGQIKNTGTRPFIDLNMQPPLPYHLIELKKCARIMFGVEHLDFFTSRGCPHQCTFCYNADFHKKQWRPMDPDLAVQRIKDFVQEYNVKGLFFNDSNLFFDLPRGRRILEGILKEGLNVSIANINIDFLTLARMDEKDFTLLERAGCRRIPIAVESGSKKIQQLLKKPVDMQRLLDINRNLKKYNMALHYAFMMGFPTETEEDLAESISLAFRLLDENPNADTSFNIFTPFPGTELFDMTVKNGLHAPERVEDWLTFNYRNLTQGAPWLSEKMRHLVEVMDFCTFLMGKRPFVQPYEKTDPVVSLLCKIYAPFAKMRVKHFWDWLPVEMKLAKLLGLYAKQD